jgi:hypothetical protein
MFIDLNSSALLCHHLCFSQSQLLSPSVRFLGVLKFFVDTVCHKVDFSVSKVNLSSVSLSRVDFQILGTLFGHRNIHEIKLLERTRSSGVYGWHSVEIPRIYP